MHSDAAIETALSNAVLKLGYPALRPHQKTAITSALCKAGTFLSAYQLAVGSPGADTGFSNRGVETRDTKSGGGGGVLSALGPTRKSGGGRGGVLSASGPIQKAGGGGGEGGAVKQKRGRYLI